MNACNIVEYNIFFVSENNLPVTYVFPSYIFQFFKLLLLQHFHSRAFHFVLKTSCRGGSLPIFFDKTLFS